MKTDIFNLIILDETGSMTGVRRHTIRGCNETIDTIRSLQKKFSETQNHYVSIFAFHSQAFPTSRYLIKNIPIEEVRHISGGDYDPAGCTPLYDAMGATLTDLKTTVAEREFAIGSVTIITDGLENDSHFYTHAKVAGMISALKEIGWNFNFIGANIDVEYTARSFNIGNYLAFDQTDKGTKEMFERDRRARGRYYDRVDSALCFRASSFNNEDEKLEALNDLKEAEADYFKEDLK